MLFPDPLPPTVVDKVIAQRELVPVTSTELFEAVLALPIVDPPNPPLRTVPPLEMTRLLLAPELPTVRELEFVQKEFAPLTVTELFEAVF